MGSTSRGRFKEFSDWLKASVVYLLFWLLRATWKLEEQELPPEITARLSAGKPVVFAHFHEDEWAMLGFYAHRQMNVMVSLSVDGGIMARFLRCLGFGIVRGSSSKGGVSGLLQLIRSMRLNGSGAVSMAIDGPRGPRGRAKKGVFKLAESLNAPIVCGAAVASNCVVFKKSWSKAFVPKPFSRVSLCYAAVMSAEEVKRGVERDDYATLSFALEERIKGAKSMARETLGAEVKTS